MWSKLDYRWQLRQLKKKQGRYCLVSCSRLSARRGRSAPAVLQPRSERATDGTGDGVDREDEQAEGETPSDATSPPKSRVVNDARTNMTSDPKTVARPPWSAPDPVGPTTYPAARPPNSPMPLQYSITTDAPDPAYTRPEIILV